MMSRQTNVDVNRSRRHVSAQVFLVQVVVLTFCVSGAQLSKKTANEKPEVMNTFLASDPDSMLNTKGLASLIPYFSYKWVSDPDCLLFLVGNSVSSAPVVCLWTNRD